MDFIVTKPLEIKNQKRTDFCLACVISSIAEQYVGEPCEESYLFAAGKKVSGEPLAKSGVSPRDLIEAAIQYGVLPKRIAPYSLETHKRDFLADWGNWKEFEGQAIKPFKSSFRVRGFDKAIETMKSENTTLLCGLYWQYFFDEKRLIDFHGEEYNKLAPHEVRIIGVENDQLVIQNSQLVGVEDNGMWHMTRNGFKFVQHMYALSQKPKKWWLLDLIDNL